MLVACSSEVDKCVSSNVAAWEAKQERIRSEVASGKKKIREGASDLYSSFDETKVTLDERSKVEIEAEYRNWCLRASSQRK